jgi:hypothetical protein
MPDKKKFFGLPCKSNQINQSINQSTPTRKHPKCPWDKQKRPNTAMYYVVSMDSITTQRLTRSLTNLPIR